MGIVYLAVAHGPARFSKLVVVKELKPELVEDPQFLEMFQEEARLAARLSHPNIVQTHEVGNEGNRHYLVMDYLDGVTLARLLRRKNTLFTRDMHLRVICEMLDGLHYAHTLTDFDGSPLGIVHRDVSPQNVFLTYDGQAKLVDFGIAKALDSNIETRTGMLKGKPAYMAPEQIGGDIDPRSDVFAAGVMIWEAVAGQRMWHKKSDVEVLTRIIKGEMPLLADVAPDAPPALIAICNRAITKDRETRFASAAELRAELETFLRENAPAVTMREVGAVVGEVFTAERTTTRSTIEAHLSRLKSGSETTVEKLPSLRPAAPSPESISNPGYDGSAPSSSLAATPPGSTLASEPLAALNLPNQKERRLKGLLVATFVGIGAVAAATFVIATRHHDDDDAGKKALSAAIAPSEAASAGPEIHADSGPRLALNEGESAAGAAVPAGPARPDPKPETRRIAAVAPIPQPRSTGYPTPHSAPPPAPTPKAAPSAAPSVSVDAPERPGPASTGYLTIDTYPWTRVTAQGRVLGDTPLVRVPLPAGTHVLTLENPNEKVHQTTVVVIKAGETVSRRLAF
ncbi:serine/threonine protein kinase [Labilithrix luteola]|uniref:Serine/threonine protein kinase n=2 Tax=Labilithrix luteola TaxID=1391654 RepID=A0A0K1QBK1_9BACT|nr:serine/threonine protein kinase [Labilithrix luteola]